MEGEELEVQNKELYNQDILQIEKRIQECLKDFSDLKAAISKKREEIEKLSRSKKSVMNLIFASSEKKETLLKECQDLEQEMCGKPWNKFLVEYTVL